jgi:hypothetical protein
MAVPILTLSGGQEDVIPQKSVPGGYPPGKGLNGRIRRGTMLEVPRGTLRRLLVQPKYTRQENWGVWMHKDRSGCR